MKKKTETTLVIDEDDKTEVWAVNRKARRRFEKLGSKNRVIGEPLVRREDALYMGDELFSPHRFEWTKTAIRAARKRK